MCKIDKDSSINESEAPSAESPILPDPETAPETPAETPEPRVDPDEFDSLMLKVAELENDIAEIQRESYKDRIIGKMQARIAELESYESTVKQFQRSIMLMFDLAEKIEEEYEEAIQTGTPPSPEQCLLDLTVLRAEVGTQIFTSGLTSYRTSAEDLEKGLELDIKRQRAVRWIPAETPEENLVVIESIRAGFIDQNERAVRKEDVIVKKYNATTN